MDAPAFAAAADRRPPPPTAATIGNAATAAAATIGNAFAAAAADRQPPRLNLAAKSPRRLVVRPQKKSKKSITRLDFEGRLGKLWHNQNTKPIRH